MKINFEKSSVREAFFDELAEDSCVVKLKASVGGITLPQVKGAGKRYIVGEIVIYLLTFVTYGIKIKPLNKEHLKRYL